MSEKMSTRENKHVTLAQAIYDIDSVINRANSLFLRIRGEDDQETNCLGMELSSLSSVLDNAPEVIRGKMSNLHDTISNIENELF